MLLLCASIFAQAPTATLQGHIEDPGGAAIPDAKVTVENQLTGVREILNSNSEGRFVQPSLLAGQYRITVEKAGFSKNITNDIQLDAQATRDLNIAMKVGEVTTSVEVSAEVAQLKTETTNASTTLQAHQLLDLPTGRNPFSLVTLTAGVIPAGGGSTPWISGGRNASSEILIDGNTGIVPENNVSIQDGGYIPVIDSLAEITVIKNGLNAEYGRTGGGTITATTRGGTNTPHVGLYEFFKNPALNANSWSNNRNGVKRASCCSQNQFGFNVGGPVVIPHIYNGRNKTFLFWSQQFSRSPGLSTPTATVPIDAWRAGDFSQLKNGSGAPITIYDPLNVTPDGIRTAFAGNLIPVSRLDPVAQKLMSYFPHANNLANVTNPYTFANDFIAQGKSSNTDNKFDSRIDEQFSQKIRMFVRGSYENNPSTPFNGFGNVGTSIGDGPSVNTFPNITSNIVFTVTPTTLINVNLGFGQKDNVRQPFSSGTKPSSLGFDPSLDAVAARNSLEFPSINTGSGNLGQATFTSLNIKSYAYTAHSDIVKVLAKHTIKAGFEYRKLMLNFTQYGSPDGQFSFTTLPTVRQVNVTTPTTEGFGFASFLLGLPNNNGGSLSHSFSAATASPYVGVFAQDDWKVSQKLTVNIGLRWDVDVPRTERYNRLNHFDLNAPSPLAGKVPGFPDLKGAWVFQTPDDRRQVATDMNNWGPRFGFAYQINSKTVFRAAYGILYSASSYTAAGTSGSSGTEGFQSNTALNVTNDNFQTIIPGWSLSNPFPSGYNLPLGAAGGAGTDLGLAIGGGNGGIFLDNQNPMIQEWNANLQRELPGGWVIEAGYMANKGNHLIDGESNMPLSQLPDSYLAQGAALNNLVTNPFYHVAGINTTSTLYTQPTVQAKQLLSAFPQYQGVTAFRIPQANSNFQSFTFEANKRLTHGLQMLVSFTGSKLLDDASQTVSFLGAAGAKQDYYNRAADKSVSSQDVPKRLVVSFNYDIPIGHHRTFLHDTPKPLDFIIGGWQINGIYTAQRAIPLAISNGNNNTGIGNPGQRPNNNGTSALKTGPIDQRLNAYFDTSVFSVAPNFTYGTSGRFSPDLRGPSLFNLDFSMFKHFKFRERLDAQLRLEAFNFFNHPTWGLPGTAVNSPGTFGVITTANGNRTMQVAMKVDF
jgi:hypothetical protein